MIDKKEITDAVTAIQRVWLESYESTRELVAAIDGEESKQVVLKAMDQFMADAAKVILETDKKANDLIKKEEVAKKRMLDLLNEIFKDDNP